MENSAILYNAIAFLDRPNDRGNKAIKYRGIKNIGKFERFLMASHGQNLTAINYYLKETKAFHHQTKFK